MAGPWESYGGAAATPEAAPWEKYGGVNAPRETSPELTQATGLSGIAKNAIGAVVEPVMSMASGAVAKPASDVAGLTGLTSELISPKGGSPTDFKASVQDRMTYQPKTQWGHNVNEYNPIALAGKAVNWLGDRGRELVGGGQGGDTARGAAGNLVGGLIEEAPAVLSAKGGKMAKESLPGKQAALDVSKGENAGVDATRMKAQANGYITPPEGGLKGAAAGLAGKAKVDKWLSAKNAENAQRTFAQELKLPEGTALTSDALDLRKQDAYSRYDQLVQQAGPKLPPTPAFRTAMQDSLKQIEEKIAFEPQTYKGLRPAAALLRSWAKKTDFPTDRTLQAIKDLRKQAKSDFIGGKGEMGTARLGVATQLENLFESHLSQGPGIQLSDFKAARADLAKINFIERVTNPETGAVDLAKVGNLANTKAYKGALTGALKDAAEFSNTYRKAAQKNVEAPPSLSVFDGLFAAGAVAGGHPFLALGELAGRTAVPYAATKGLLQKPPPSYDVGRARKAAPYALPAAGIGASGQIDRPPQ